jgi:predicted dehydrogenase
MIAKKTIGVIGPGKHFENKIYPVIKKSNSYHLSGVLRKKKKDFKNIKAFNEVNFFKQNFDFIYISCPSTLHEKYILKALKSGSHVICEKPFILSKNNINKIINLSRKKNKLIFEAFMYLYHPVFKYLKTVLEKKMYGRIKYIISNFRFPSLNKRNNRYDPNLGRGFYFDSASYLISLDTHIANFLKEKKISFSARKIKHIVDLRGSILINYKNSQRFYFWGEGQKYSNNIEIFCEKATLYIDKFFSKNNDDKISMRIFLNKKEKIINFKKNNQFSEMFLNVIRNYKDFKFKEYHRNLIKQQINNLEKYEKNFI